MSAFKYTPDRQIQVHREGAVRQMCAPFKSHKDGLPEWVKNSSDAYSIAERAPQNRVIVVFAKDSKQPQEKSIACLDFVGMSVERLEESFSNWGDPEAAALSANVRETRSTQRIRVGRRQRNRTCWDCEREWKRMVVPLEPGRPSEARQLLRTRR